MKRPVSKQNKWADHYTRRARQEQYPARSVYKLQELQKRFKLIESGDRVLDLGCAPGSWTLYAAKLVGRNGRVIGIDQHPVKERLPENAETVIGDIFRVEEDGSPILEQTFNVVLSDMAPSTTGRKDVDAARSAELCRAALNLAETLLETGGNFCCKIFTGQDAKPFSEGLKKTFRQVRQFKPQSSRKASKEVFFIGLGKK
ncbi:23S rRNA (uridine(2552)-2'-O)-methyltransferase (EC [Olavius algarvensis associated proteobacterium Delta 3]|nr:23S rRNA (uridine(2552)-2'-O)-methyltransferase (EC [Olavius algarvensis associated proteobacterium Delta 3]CAB5166330.1 23S rRNA (uridine(2552)-2'-O)-methyltransferase (EC [Olavius algarvensis associated proteobacterium Delta 3]